MRRVGERLGPYEILSPLGAGAMGEVYRARDTRLGREVALKVLPERTAADPEALARFTREARAASALDHPNVVTIHDVGSTEAAPWIAMELVEGRTLRAILKEAGRLPARRALDLAAQIADGLASAHEKGLVHRDIKPENLKITAEGVVKILDFGLARLTKPLPVDHSSPTQPVNPTEAGAFIGTVNYMSAEQAAGRPAEFPADQFALGAVLHEMLSGHPPFHRGTVGEILTAIIREEPPPLPRIEPSAQLPIQLILDRCLAKEPSARYASTRDLARDLRALADRLRGASESERLGETVTPRPHRRTEVAEVATIAAIALAAAAVLGFLLGRGFGRRPPPSFEQLTFQRGTVVSARFAPDGDTFVYSAAWEGGPFQLYRKDPETPQSVPLPTSSGWLLSVSSSGQIAFSVSPRILPPGRSVGMLAQAPFTGGAEKQVLADVEFADWSPDGKDLAVVRELAGRTVLEFPIGRKIFETGGWIGSPRVSRSGDRIAFLEHPARGDDRGSIVVWERGSNKWRRYSPVWGSARGLAWSPEGDEVWLAGTQGPELRGLHAVSLSGRVRTVAHAPGALMLLDVSPRGHVLVARETRYMGISAILPPRGESRDLSWLDSSVVTDLSADGRRVLFTEFGQGGGPLQSVFLRGVDGSPPVRLGEGLAKSLSPDGTSALSVLPASPPQLILLSLGPGQPQTIREPTLEAYQWASFLSDGRRLVIAGNEPGRGVRLYVRELPSGPLRPLGGGGIASDHYQGLPVSPDGRWIAAVGSDGRISLVPSDGGEAQPVPGATPGMLPVQWAADGRSLFASRLDEIPARVVRLDPLTGRSEPWRAIAPADPAGVHTFVSIRLTPDGTTCVYSYVRLLSEIYRVEGLE